MFPILYGILALIEFGHALGHVFVLTGLHSIKFQSCEFRIFYFSLDLISSILSYILTQKNFTMVFIHFMIHVFAVLHLIKPFSELYKNIFELAEHRFSDKPNAHLVFYVIGTTQDILTHCINGFLLYSLISL